MRITVLSMLVVLVVSLNGQYDFRTQQIKQDYQTFYLGNRALDDGSFIAIGITEDEISNSSQMVLVKINCLGETEWAKTLGGSILVNNIRGGITQADNGDIVFAYSLAVDWFSASMLVGRYTLDGEKVWAKRIGINKEYARDIVATPDGGFVIAGSTTTFGPDRQRADVYMAKLDAAGNVLWTKAYGNPDAYDDAYGISLGSNGELLLTGRYIVGGTFYSFFLKADPDGNPLVFKGYGQPNHRTYAYDVIETPEGDYLISGFTTIAKVDHTSHGDAFLLKVDDQGELLFSHIYEPLEDDRNDFGFSIVLEDDGDYGIALESSSFRAIGGPQAPNKNVIYSVDDGGFIKYVQLFNPKGSQYTTMTKAPDGGYFLTGFSTYYLNNSTFEPFTFKTDANYGSGQCEVHDRTDKVATLQLPWDSQEIAYSEGSNTRITDYNIENELVFDSSRFHCFRYPQLFAEIIPPFADYCEGQEITFGDNSLGSIQDWEWKMGNGDTLHGKSIDYVYDSAGTYEVILTIFDGCLSRNDTLLVEIGNGDTLTESQQLCPGDTLVYMDSTITEGGTYTFFEAVQGACPKTIILDVLEKDECPCEGIFPNAFTPNRDGMNDVFGMHEEEGGCTPIDVRDFKMTIYNRWGQEVFHSEEINNKWDGRFKGEECPSEVYLVKYAYFVGDKSVTKTTDVTLIR